MFQGFASVKSVYLPTPSSSLTQPLNQQKKTHHHRGQTPLVEWKQVCLLTESAEDLKLIGCCIGRRIRSAPLMNDTDDVHSNNLIGFRIIKDFFRSTTEFKLNLIFLLFEVFFGFCIFIFSNSHLVWFGISGMMMTENCE